VKDWHIDYSYALSTMVSGGLNDIKGLKQQIKIVSFGRSRHLNAFAAT
jgi:hypothetical protein